MSKYIIGIDPYDKQETLEEVAENYVDSFEYGIAHPRRVCKNAFINGAKWQQQRSYSEEEVKIMYRSLWVGNSFDFDTSYEMESNFEHDFNLWFEQNKKK